MTMLRASTISLFYPVAKVTWHPQSRTMKVHRECKLTKEQISHGTRKAISSLSRSSLVRLAYLTANTSTRFKSILTLTFLSPPNLKEAKRQLNKLLVSLSRKLERPLKYLWFLEFQVSGKAHFHLLMDISYSREYHIFLAVQ